MQIECHCALHARHSRTLDASIDAAVWRLYASEPTCAGEGREEHAHQGGSDHVCAPQQKGSRLPTHKDGVLELNRL
jgi:hypothetical protein